MKMFVIMLLATISILNAKQIHLFSCATLYNYNGNTLGTPMSTKTFNVHDNVFEVIKEIKHYDKLYCIIKYNGQQCAVSYGATVSDDVYNTIYNKNDKDKIQPASKSTSSPDIKNTTSESQTKSKASTSVQCSGVTKKGKRCRKMTNHPSGKCHHHR